MPARKRTTLPKEFDKLLEAGDLAALQAVFDRCEIGARGGYAKQTALAFAACPDELARWLVARGADVNAPDAGGDTPLHARARDWRARIDVLLELGADVHATNRRGDTPLHVAAGAARTRAVELLLAHGARADATGDEGLNPLEAALRRCANAALVEMAEIAQRLVDAGAPITPAMSKHVRELGQRFEFHRAGFARDHVGAASAALERLYALFGVPPVPRRAMHDGRAPIRVTATTWQRQHAELWELLVPSSGPAATVQGEVIRIAGRLSREFDDNGGINWDDAFVAMACAFREHVAGGTALTAPQLAEVRAIVDGLAARAAGDTDRLAELAVAWVLRNPTPVALASPAYRR
ncbi:MAG TPA: ankyrin repeat domain-containing protein [Kofleriaceae bacterium]|nr:ankyrin repeat domain-containing protein [Kofleriaceae bacterium]